MTHDSQSSAEPQSKERQRSGVACAECRRRKLRCDGERPHCGNCEQSGVVCQMSTHHNPRGPRKGYMAALRKRIGELENRLASQQPQMQQIQPGVTLDPLLDLSGEENLSDWTDFDVNHAQFENIVATDQEATFSNLLPNTTVTTTTPSLPFAVTPVQPQPSLSGFMPAELDQLYFERINPAIPLLHQRSYLSWSRKEPKKNSRICLQRAMWTLAALSSAQFQYLHESLYQSTTQMLQVISTLNTTLDPFDKEQIQAWLLITVYELTRSFHRQAWMSAGRAFRLIQLLRLHELDIPTQATSSAESFIEMEEKRRAFWMAYLLDHLFSISNNWPITLNEHVICTRLLASESEFQSDRPCVGSFLSEAINERQPRYPSVFNEAIVLATLCGRRLFNRQQFHVRSAYGDTTSPQWMDLSLMLDIILNRRLEILSQCYPSPENATSPLIHFVHCMAQLTVVYSFTGMVQINEETAMRAEYQMRALAAADQFIKLAKTLTETFVFKIHPLTPIPMMLCAEFLFKNQLLGEMFKSRLDKLLSVFEQIRDINNPKQSYIDVMKHWPCSAKENVKTQDSPDG